MMLAVLAGHESTAVDRALGRSQVTEVSRMTELTDYHEEALYERVAQIIEAAQAHVSRTVNTAMVHAYWLIGREIVEVEQQGSERDGDHFYVDLVFYNRLLRCFVLIDLKLGKLAHQDLGQMQMYVNFFDRHQREEWEAPTVGIVLCSDKNEAMVRITLPEGNEQIHATRYQLYLPTEEQLREELVIGRERIERARRLAGKDASDGEAGDDGDPVKGSEAAR